MIQGITINELLALSTIVFFIGIYGFLTRKNLISILMSAELIINSVAMNFVIFNKYLFPGQIDGYFFAMFMIAIAAAEVAVAIAIIVDLYRLYKSVDVSHIDKMKF